MNDTFAGSSYQQDSETSYLSAQNADFVERLYDQYLDNPESVDKVWRAYFDQITCQNEVNHSAVRNRLLRSIHSPSPSDYAGVSATQSTEVDYGRAFNIHNLLNSYRRYGHLQAQTNPLATSAKKIDVLSIQSHHLSDADLAEKVTFQPLTQQKKSVQEICTQLDTIYCGAIGFEYKHISQPDEVNWLQHKIECDYPKWQLSDAEKKQVLKDLVAADGLEKYLGKKYVAQKRFSLEGGDALVAMTNYLVHQSSAAGVREIVLGMPHRGRLNVMVNVLGLPTEQLFDQFAGKHTGDTTGDVKYHLGYSSDVATKGGSIHLALAFNPSHLEVISGVVLGSTHSRQRRYDTGIDAIVPLIFHGDAAFAGQGIVMETLNMSQTHAYHVGGAIHVVVNNQVGFTTSDPHDARSGPYCTDPAKLIDAPILHVNGDDVEAVLFAMDMAFAYRQKFHKDVVIDLVCYRLHGHNEADEPSATQPLMYQLIKKHKAPHHLYAQQLVEQNLLTQAQHDDLMQSYRSKLDVGQSTIDVLPDSQAYAHCQTWTPFLDKQWRNEYDSTYDLSHLKMLAQQLSTVPEGFTLQRQVNLVIKHRQAMASGEKLIDWGFAENLAYASLVTSGVSVRLSGQDCQRGTFAHRHAVWHDQTTDQCYMPLQQLSADQANIDIYNSLLSEEAVLGFEYGHATADPDTLVMWEAQFGDFANGAQVIIDQFISSGWQKWQRLCGLVLLLPHGQEGMGPEHSSARLERFLQLCAQDNIQVCVPTTPAQIYHLLRRQMLRPFRRPLVVMTPKSLLRHRLAVSSLEDLSQGQFKLVLAEREQINASKVKRIVLCSGKVYYDLLQSRNELKRQDIAIIRIEQLYPFPYEELEVQLKKYSKAKEVIWCQEEPKNQGAWFITQHRLTESLQKGQTLKYVGPQPMAAPAVGYASAHKAQQEKLIKEAIES